MADATAIRNRRTDRAGRDVRCVHGSGCTASRDESTELARPHGSRPAKYLKIAAILLYWIAALWLARDGPVSAKLVGSFMLMLFLIATIIRPARSDRD
jgi:hypothetical protein